MREISAQADVSVGEGGWQAMVQHKAIADLAGVSLDDLDCLLRGTATARTARRMGVTMMDVEDFLRGSASAAMANRLGLTISATEELAQLRGVDGPIGIILGLMISERS